MDTILRIKTVFEETKTLKDRRRNIRRQNIRNLAIVQYFRINPMSSIPQAGSTRSKVWPRAPKGQLWNSSKNSEKTVSNDIVSFPCSI